MRNSLVANPHFYIGDGLGRPLDFGMIYFGQANKDPEFYPIDIYADEALTIPLAQPVRTKGGFMCDKGDLIEAYAAEKIYSVKVLDSYGRTVFYLDAMSRNNLADDIVVAMDIAGTVKRTQLDKNNDFISVKDFGAKGDGITDDTAAIQKAIEYSINNQVSLHFPTSDYAVSQTLLIPRLYDPTFEKYYNVQINCNNSNFIMLADVTLFESAYYNNGVLMSNYGTPPVTINTFGVILQNFYITSKVGYLKKPALKIQDWHQGCALKNISSQVCQTILLSNDNFYCEFDNINGSYSEGKIGNRFIFEADHNLCRFSRLVAVNSDVGYWFKGSLTACQFTTLSFEGMRQGIVFDNYVYDASIENSYIEGISDVAIVFNSYAQSIKISNNYINFVDHPNMYFMQYAPLPGTSIEIEKSNYFNVMPDESHIIKNKEDSYGHGIVIQRAKSQAIDIDKLLVDKTKIGENIDWQQVLDFGGFIANVNNKFITGNYSGRYTSGMNLPNGFKWVNLSSNTLRLDTKIINSQTQKIYVNLAIDNGANTTMIAGEFIGGFSASTFYQYTDTGIVKSTALSLSVTSDGFVQINGALSGIISNVLGEIRLI